MTGIALTLTQLDDPGVTATTVFLRGGNIVEKDFYGFFLVQPRCHQTAVLDRSELAQSDHLFGDRPGGLGLGQGGRHSLVFD